MEEKKNRSRFFGIILGSVLFLGGIVAVTTIRRTRAPKEEISPIRPLKTIIVGQTYDMEIRNYPGKISAGTQVVLAFQVNGPLIELPIKKGQKVRKGELLARVDQRDYKNAVVSAQAKFNKAQTHLERIRRSVESGAVSKTDLTNAEASFEIAQANLETQEKALEDTSIYAQFDGIIGDVFVDNFQNVQAKEPILILQDVTTLEIEADVPESRVIAATPSQKGQNSFSKFVAFFDHLPDSEFKVTFKEVATKADPLTQTYLVVFRMPAPKNATILPGMTVTLREYRSLIPGEAKQTFLIPTSAGLLDPDGSYFVWKVLKNHKDEFYTVKKQSITVQEMTGNQLIVTQGLQKDDRIASAGVDFLQDDQQVRLYTTKGEKQ